MCIISDYTQRRIRKYTKRRITADELTKNRDLARNPSDLRGDTDFYPHCSANVETRNESVFAARNVIDGLRFNTSHGEWPFESWGIGARTDAWCKIDFGREVIADRMALTLRADFPHDAYWVSGSVADKMGQMICAMGHDMQVFAITHLPQVAAKGDAHYLVEKTFEGNGAVTKIHPVEGEDRVMEIARMLSGSHVTPAAVENAKSLLSDQGD